MRRLLRKYFRLVYIAGIAACVALGANAWGHLRAAGRATGERQPPLHGTAPSAAEPARSKAGAALAGRNMFCSTCDEAQPALRRPIALPLTLIATNVANRDDESFATIRHRVTHRTGAYRMGDTVPDVGVVEKIRGAYVDILDESSQTVQRLNLGGYAPTESAPAVAGLHSTAAHLDELTAAAAAGVKRVDDTHYEVDRELIETVISDPTRIKGARVVPGKAGLKLYGIRTPSAFSHLGLRNGDVLTSVNGIALDGPDGMLDAFAAARTATTIRVTVTRRDTEVTLSYTVR